MKKINTVIVTYNRKKLLIECLEAVLNQSYQINKIIVIDNASTDGTKEWLLEKYSSAVNIELVFLSKNYGGAGGFYYGIRKAFLDGCDWIWAMDDDTIPNENALEELLRASDLIKGKISFLASTVYGPEGEPMNVPTLSSELSANGYQDWYYYLNESIVKIDSATLVSLLFNYNAVKEYGAPHPGFFIWGDDSEYTLRLTHNYGPAYFVGKSRALHKRFGAKNLSIIDEENENRLNLYYHLYTNRLVIFHSYFPFKSRLRLRKNMIFEILKILFTNRKYKLKKVFTIFRGWKEYIFNQYGKNDYLDRFQNIYIDLLDEHK